MTAPFDRRRFLRAATAVALGAASVPFARAATGGRTLIGFQVPGIAATLFEMVLAGVHERYRPDLGLKPVVIPGGSGALALDATIKAPADGSTALILPSSAWTLLPLTRNLADEPADHLVPVAGMAELCFAFAVGPAVPPSVRTIGEYVEWVRQNPQLATYGTPGNGTAPFFVGREMTRTTGLPLKSVTYKGMQGMQADIVSGALPAGVLGVPETNYQSRLPGMRLLAVTSGQRLAAFPDIPTMTEAGLMASPAIESLGFFFAAGTPDAKVDELATAVHAVMATPALQGFMAATNTQPVPTASRYAAVLAAERDTWVQLAKRVDGGARP